MTNLTLKFLTEERNLSLNETIDDVRKRWQKDETEYYADQSISLNEYLIYGNLGVSLLFKDGLFKSAFLYIYDKFEEYKPFEESCTYLDREFWEAPNLKNFITRMKIQGFTSEKTGSDRTTKYLLNDTVSCVYSDMRDEKHIFFGFDN